ncbi:hypothetical protein AB2S62_18435 [Vibrio sp. NTOU-M3]|uniref:hypothetical protein n=1 Tax=Vibrio sp. NTOU-M3 TaxID=3234954 RepID=UPI00349FAD6B
MNSQHVVKFDVQEQLEQIKTFTEQQQQEVQQLISTTKAFKAESITSSVNKIETEVSGMMSDIECQLEQEIDNINQQLQTLLPKDIQ